MKKMLQLFGWGMFMICSVLYIISSARMGDWLFLCGSVIFLLACLIFALPLLFERDNSKR